MSGQQGDAGKTASAPPSEEPFAAAKANIRETVKWLAAAMAAIVPALLAGASITGLGGLPPVLLAVSLFGACLGLTCLLAGLRIVFELLTSEVFTLGDIQDADNRWMVEWFNRRSRDVLPLGYGDIGQLIEQRDRCIALARQTGDPDAAAKAAAHLAALGPSTRQITSLAHLLLLRKRLLSTAPKLLLLAFGTILGFGTIAWATGTAKEANPVKQARPALDVMVSIDMDTAWDKLAAALKAACGEHGKLDASFLGQPARGWLEFEIDEPSACSGVRLSLPGELAIGGMPLGHASPSRPAR